MSKKRDNDFFYQFHARFGHSSARNFHLKISMTGIKYYFFIKRKEKNVSVNYINLFLKKLTDLLETLFDKRSQNQNTFYTSDEQNYIFSHDITI